MHINMINDTLALLCPTHIAFVLSDNKPDNMDKASVWISEYEHDEYTSKIPNVTQRTTQVFFYKFLKT